MLWHDESTAKKFATLSVTQPHVVQFSSDLHPMWRWSCHKSRSQHHVTPPKIY